MSATENKQRMRAIWDELAKGNGKLFMDSVADDFVWHMIGSSPWSGTYRGKKSVSEDLMGPLFSQFADQYINTADLIIAEDDWGVVQCRGKVTTKSGKPYNNTYCWVCRFENGKMVELTEYLDTALLDTALEPPKAKTA